MPVKRKILALVILFALAVIAAACGAAVSPTSQWTRTGSQSTTPNAQQTKETGSTDPLSLSSELLVGTFRLEGTPNAVDAKTAAALIPLWKSFSDLSANSSAPQAEIDGAVSRIKSAMTLDQMQAITALNLTQHDLNSLLWSVELMAKKTANGGSPSARTPANGVTKDPGRRATNQALRNQRGTSDQLTGPLVDALIHLLQQRAGLATDAPTS